MKKDEELNPWKILSTSVFYENPWIRLDEHQVIRPRGDQGIYSVVHFKNFAIAVVPLDDENNTWIVGQYRLPVNEYSWEVPEGGGPLHLDTLESAQRELLEETGIKAEEWIKVQNFSLSNSGTDETGMVYVAKKLSFFEPEPEATEVLTVKKISFNELYEKVMQNEITDGLSVIAVLKVKALMDRRAI